MAIIAKSGQAEQEVNERISGFFQSAKMCEILKKANAYKSRGIPVMGTFTSMATRAIMCALRTTLALIEKDI